MTVLHVVLQKSKSRSSQVQSVKEHCKRSEEWVETWRPIVEEVSKLLGEEIEYHHCDFPDIQTDRTPLYPSMGKAKQVVWQ